MRVKAFGESEGSPPSIQYYLDENNNKIDCNETTIHKIWSVWVCMLGVKRYWEGNVLIYEFPTTTEID